MAMKKEALTNLIADDLDKRNENWTEIDDTFALKADKSTTYTKTEVDTSLDLKADKQQEAWITPTLLSGATTDTENTLQYRKNQFGVVEFKGVFTPEQIGVLSFSLPTGYRPISNKCKILVVSTDDVIGRINFYVSGVYPLASLHRKEINMTGVSFPTV